MKVNYNSTIRSCFIGYIVQAIVNNFVPAVVYYVSIAIQYTAVEDNIINYNQLWFTAYNRFLRRHFLSIKSDTGYLYL